jgi:hypothetical protein
VGFQHLQLASTTCENGSIVGPNGKRFGMRGRENLRVPVVQSRRFLESDRPRASARSPRCRSSSRKNQAWRVGFQHLQLASTTCENGSIVGPNGKRFGMRGLNHSPSPGRPESPVPRVGSPARLGTVAALPQLMAVLLALMANGLGCVDGKMIFAR